MDRFGFSGWAQIFELSAPNYAGPKFACVWPLITPEVSDSFREFVEAGHPVGAIDCSAFAVPAAP